MYPITGLSRSLNAEDNLLTLIEIGLNLKAILSIFFSGSDPLPASTKESSIVKPN